MYTILDFAIVKISGSDSEAFLQNFITNDIKKTEDGTIYSMMLNNQGRYIFDFFITKEGSNSYLVEIVPINLNKLIGKLGLYKLGKDVDIEHIPHYKVIYSYEEQEEGDTVIHSYRDPRFIKMGFRSIVHQDYFSSHKASSINLYYEDKYNYAIPDGEVDLEQESSIPVEYGIDQLNGLSYNKGCYVGQEVIARVKNRGVIRKKIFKLESDECNLDKLDREILSEDEDEKIGKIISSRKNQAIALLKMDKINGDIILIKGFTIDVFSPEWQN